MPVTAPVVARCAAQVQRRGRCRRGAFADAARRASRGGAATPLPIWARPGAVLAVGSTPQ
eukprot:11214943-Lingulodinium_polyedra.AAC.1